MSDPYKTTDELVEYFAGRQDLFAAYAALVRNGKRLEAENADLKRQLAEVTKQRDVTDAVNQYNASATGERIEELERQVAEAQDAQIVVAAIEKHKMTIDRVDSALGAWRVRGRYYDSKSNMAFAVFDGDSLVQTVKRVADLCTESGGKT